jgi:hypothetical protein
MEEIGVEGAVAAEGSDAAMSSLEADLLRLLLEVPDFAEFSDNLETTLPVSSPAGCGSPTVFASPCDLGFDLFGGLFPLFFPAWRVLILSGALDLEV